MAITIGISKASGSEKYQNYVNWVLSADEEVDYIDLWLSQDLDADLKRIDGLLLTGGGDVDPVLYGMPEAAEACDSIDVVRDGKEYAMLDYAFEHHLPVLGVCRGIQIINVYQSGTLMPHVPDRKEVDIHGKDDGRDRLHEVEVTPGTLLYKATRELSGAINSAHHQAIDAIGHDLEASAVASDGIVEGLEWKDPGKKSYLLAVQWHPERMKNKDGAFAKRILDQFLFEVNSAKILSNTSLPLPKEEPAPIEPSGADDHQDPLLPIIG